MLLNLKLSKEEGLCKTKNPGKNRDFSINKKPKTNY